jgi:hypothetical protein
MQPFTYYITTIMSRPCLSREKNRITSQSASKINNVFIHYKLNQLLNYHPCVVKIFIIMISKRRHACCNTLRSSTFCSNDYILAQWVPCIWDKTSDLSKTILFWLNHTANNMTPIPTSRSFCIPPCIFRTHIPNICFMLTWGINPNDKYITRQMNLVRSQSKKMCCIVS